MDNQICDGKTLNTQTDSHSVQATTTEAGALLTCATLVSPVARPFPLLRNTAEESFAIICSTVSSHAHYKMLM